jgi:hypothetical protein
VAAALRAHPEDKMGVQYYGCAALGSLAENHPANAAAAREAGCVQLIAAAMCAYPNNENIQHAGRGALKILEPGHALLA